MVDVADSKSADGDIVWVRVPPPAPRRSKLHIACSDFYAQGKKSERAHYAAPPFQTEAASLGFDLGFFNEIYKFCIATGTTSPRTTYRSRRLFCKSHFSLILSRLLSKSNPLRWASIWYWVQIRKSRHLYCCDVPKIDKRRQGLVDFSLFTLHFSLT